MLKKLVKWIKFQFILFEMERAERYVDKHIDGMWDKYDCYFSLAVDYGCYHMFEEMLRMLKKIEGDWYLPSSSQNKKVQELSEKFDGDYLVKNGKLLSVTDIPKEYRKKGVKNA